MEVKGISERKAMEIASQVNEKRDLTAGDDLFAAVWNYYESCGKNL